MNAFSAVKKLTKSDTIGLKECFTPVSKSYDRGEIITICSPNDDTIGIITEGLAYLTTSNYEEQRRILDFYEEGNVFGSRFLPASENKLFYVTAKTACKVDFVKYTKLITCCSNNCQKHTAAINGLIVSTAEKSLMHIDILAQRTLKGKLLTFFDYLASNSSTNSFTIPLPFSDLADYLAVDRSAMMREIKKLNQEGIIKSDKKKITILN
jgi:CRP-like cAMP-binding protein